VSESDGGAVIRERAAANRHSQTRHDVVDEVLDDHLANFEPPGSDEEFVRVDGERPDLPALIGTIRGERDAARPNG
jgi:hypothetical protein